MEIIKPVSNFGPSQSSQATENAVTSSARATGSQNESSTKEADSKPQSQKPPLASGQIAAEIREINEALQNIERSIRFRVSENSQEPIIRVVNSDTGELIREIPSEALQRISSALKGNLEAGLIVKVEA